MEMNDVIKEWLYGNSLAMYPSIYLSYNGTCSAYRENMVSTRMMETERVTQGLDLPILPYFGYRWVRGGGRIFG